MWLATSNGVLKYNGYNFKAVNLPDQQKFEKRTLHVDHKDRLWIASRSGGLITYFAGKNIEYKINFQPAQQGPEFKLNKIQSNADDVYIATNQGLFSADLKHSQINLLAFDGRNINDIFINQSGRVFVAQSNQLFVSQLNQGDLQSKIIHSFADNEIITAIHQKSTDKLLIGTNQFLYEYDESLLLMKKVVKFKENRVTSIAVDENHVWVGTLLNGLYVINRKFTEIENFKHIPNNQKSLSDNAVVSLHLNDSGVLFVGTFYGNMSMLNTRNFAFGAKDNSSNGLSCLNSNIIYSFFQDQDNSLWLSTEKDLVQSDTNQQKCISYQVNETGSPTSYPEIKSIFKDSKNQYWVATNKGLKRVNSVEKKIENLNSQVPQISTLFAMEIEPEKIVIGTESGLYLFDTFTESYTGFDVGEEALRTAEFITFAQQDNGGIYLISDKGLTAIEHHTVFLVNEVNQQTNDATFTDIHIDSTNGDLWLASINRGLFQFSQNHELINHYQLGRGFTNNAQLLDVLEDGLGYIWISSFNGLYRLHKASGLIHRFQASDGLQGNVYKRGASLKGIDGKLYFGGVKGFNGFYPDDIKLNQIPPQTQLTSFSYFNRKITPNSDSEFDLKRPISELKELVLTHEDYIFGFEFAALDYADSSRNTYAYRLLGLNNDWVGANADDRKVVYTNLKPATYSFEVKAANKDGIWSTAPTVLKIKVKPAPWYTWWAYLSYVLLTALLLYLFIKRKISRAQLVSKLLKEQVTEQTAHISQQNKMLESLMLRKNELFANVSHEFRTPLTLILGPVEELLKSTAVTGEKETLQMIKRNADRLLSLINQLLLLAQFTENKSTSWETKNVASTVQVIVASFENAALSKRIDLSIDRLHEGVVKVTADALETIVGNFLSNAIKYTQVGGSVTVGVVAANNEISIHVKDTGCGFDQKREKEIFERFKRINPDSSIEGVGIGLALVEEIAQANHAQIDVKSQIGKGSVFKISFPTVTDAVNSHKVSNTTLERLSSHINNPNNLLKPQRRVKAKDTVLIIEDNSDMQIHIQNVLNKDFNCLIASNGKDGVALALREIPDIIICDVMMPGMDGFEVSRILRGDTLTSHIPLVLLTALNEKSSRVKGWRENIDMYLTKPFDTNELKLQLRNILNIRSILNKKIQGKVFQNSQQNYSDLPDVDYKFINKLTKIIQSNYQDPTIDLSGMAHLMHVSERQLQRKSQALANLSPSDMLRDYRLKMAAQSLINGYQVSITSDQCGFNSVSYFSNCFKKKYGLSPKQYQKLNKNHS